MSTSLINKAGIGVQMVALMAFTANVFAADNLLDEIIERGELRVGTTGDYKPFSYRVMKNKNRETLNAIVAENIFCHLRANCDGYQFVLMDRLINPFKDALANRKDYYFSYKTRRGVVINGIFDSLQKNGWDYPNRKSLTENDFKSSFENRVAMIGIAGDFGSFRTGIISHPFFRKHDKGGYIGFDIDMAENLADRLGVKLRIIPTTWSTLSQDLKDKQYDIAMTGVSVNLERQKIGFYSMPYLRDGKTPITLCINKDRFQTLAQIDTPITTVIVNPGGTNQKFANEHLKEANIKVHPNNVTIFTQIIEGKADLMITDAVETRLQAKIHPELCALHPEKPFDFLEKAYLMPRDLVFQQFVNQWLRQMIESGAFDQRFDQWINYSWQAADKE